MPQVSGSNDAVPWPRTPPIAFEYRRPVADDPSPDDLSNTSDSDSDSDPDSDLSDEAQSRVQVIFYPSIDLASRDAWGSRDDGVVLEAETQYMELDTQITYPRRSVAVQEIPMAAVGAAEIARGVNCCAVCVEDYTEGERVSRLPCGHCFHKDCISPWFQIRVTCPICRFKLV